MMIGREDIVTFTKKMFDDDYTEDRIVEGSYYWWINTQSTKYYENGESASELAVGSIGKLIDKETGNVYTLGSLPEFLPDQYTCFSDMNTALVKTGMGSMRPDERLHNEY